MSDTRGDRLGGDRARAASDGALSVSAECELLASKRRRDVVRYLCDRPGDPVSLAELTDYLSVVEEPTDARDVRRALHHVHLPKLARAGVVAYTAPQHTVTYRPDERLEEHLAFLDEREALL